MLMVRMDQELREKDASAYLRQEMEIVQQEEIFKSWYGDGDRVFSPQALNHKVWMYIDGGSYGDKEERLNQAVAFLGDMNQKLLAQEATVEDMLEKDISTYEVKA